MRTPEIRPAESTPARAALDVARLRRLRTAVQATLALGVAASLAANVLHAEPTAVGRAIAAWPPVALLLTIELISRVPVIGRPWLAASRIIATTAIASIAAWVSYWHMVEVAAAHGEAVTSAHLIPLSVDGLVVVASVCLVEISGHLRTAETRAQVADLAPVKDTSANPAPVEVAPVAVEPTTPAEPTPAPPEAAPVPQPRRAPNRAPGAATARTVARLRRQHPGWTVGQIAERAGVSERTARRHLNAPTTGNDPAHDTATDTAPDAAPADVAA